jgi:hypothetical protein
MTGPIEKALAQIAPDYQITSADRSEIARAEDPERVAEWLQYSLQDWREDFARSIDPPCDPALIPMKYAIDAANLSIASKGQSLGLGTMQAALGRGANFDLGRAIGRAEAEQKDAIAMAFLHTHGRPIRAGGRAYYSAQLKAGRLLSAIVAEFERNAVGR